jgi:hypothetical protein
MNNYKDILIYIFIFCHSMLYSAAYVPPLEEINAKALQVTEDYLDNAQSSLNARRKYPDGKGQILGHGHYRNLDIQQEITPQRLLTQVQNYCRESAPHICTKTQKNY